MNAQYGKTLEWQQVTKGCHPTLSDNEIHLWWLPLTLSVTQEKVAQMLLSDIQKDRYHRRKSVERKLCYLAGRYYLLNLLGQYTATPANQILLSYTRLNKPYLSNKEHNIQFNFTDTNLNWSEGTATVASYGLFAFCKKRAIGVDIESLERCANFAAISANRFSKKEQQYVENENGTVNGQRCLAIWTRKEAFGKAIGKGINFKMNALDLSSGNSFDLNFSSHEQDWRLTQIQLPHNVISCVAHEGHQALEIKAFNSANHFP